MQSSLFNAIVHYIFQAPTGILSVPHDYKIISSLDIENAEVQTLCFFFQPSVCLHPVMGNSIPIPPVCCWKPPLHKAFFLMSNPVVPKLW